MNRLYTVLIFIAILCMCMYMFFAALRPHYFSRTSFVFVPESELVGMHMNQVLNDAVFIMRESLKGDDVLVKYGANVVIERIEDTNIVSVAVYGKTVNITAFVEKYVLENVIQHVHTYYATDLISMKIVQRDEMPQKTVTAQVIPYVVMFLIATGLIAGVFTLFHYIDQLRDRRVPTPSINGKKIFEKFYESRQNMPVAHSEENVRKEMTAPVEEEKVPNQDDIKIVQEEEKAPMHMKKTVVEVAIPDGISATPGNLPIVDVSALGFAKPKEEKQQEVDMAQYKEPTEEELKARLNALLSGKL